MKKAVNGKRGMPREVAIVVKRLNEEVAARKERGAHFEVDPYAVEWLFVTQPIAGHNDYWGIASNYEDGSEATLWTGEGWVYREPQEGTDNRVPGGRTEVIENWVCFFTA